MYIEWKVAQPNQEQIHNIQILTAQLSEGDKTAMNTHNSIKFFLSITAALVIAVIGMQLTTESAAAHTMCKVRLPGGGWTEGCPHPHIPRPPENPSCLAVMTETYYEFRISNATGHMVYYSINGESFSLSDGYGRNHKYRQAYGTNSCNTKHYANPVINFDYSYDNGYQARSYKLGDNNQETFYRSGNGIDLRH